MGRLATLRIAATGTRLQQFRMSLPADRAATQRTLAYISEQGHVPMKHVVFRRERRARSAALIAALLSTVSSSASPGSGHFDI